MKHVALAALVAASFFGSSSIEVQAQDKTCAKAKNPTHKGVCNCAAAHGGRVEEQANGRIRWFAPRGGGGADYQKCMAKYQA